MFHKRLLAEFRTHNKFLAGMVFAQWVALLLQVVMVYTIALFLYQIYIGEVTAQSIEKLLVVLSIVVIGKSLCNSLQQRLSHQASSVVKISLREKIYGKLMKIGTGYNDIIPTAEAVQISTEGVEQLEIYFAKYVPQFFYSLLAPITLFIITCQMSVKVAVILLVCVPLIPISIMAVQKFAKKLLQKYWGSYTELGDSFLENIKGLTTLKIFGADKRYEQKMNDEAENFRKITMRVLIMQLNSISMMDLVAFGGAALGIYFSVVALQNHEITFVQCFFIIMISAEFFLPLRLLGSYFHIAMNGNAAANKIFALLDQEESKSMPEKKVEEKKQDSYISCQHVSFGYSEKTVIKDISFEVPTNTFTAIVGISGCGKSTLASLLMGKWKNYQGEIKMQGTSLANMEESEVFKRITYVGHNSYILKGTVKETLQMGNSYATEIQMYQVLEQVDMLSIVLEKGGLSMLLEEGASNLSGGQKQRLAIARAILHDSDCYIFDEATSNVDVESEDCILEVMKELAKTKTIIMITHRLANVVSADRILFMEKGMVKEEGTHTELMKMENGAYYKLFLMQQALEQVREEKTS